MKSKHDRTWRRWRKRRTLTILTFPLTLTIQKKLSAISLTKPSKSTTSILITTQTLQNRISSMLAIILTRWENTTLQHYLKANNSPNTNVILRIMNHHFRAKRTKNPNIRIKIIKQSLNLTLITTLRYWACPFLAMILCQVLLSKN